MWLRFDTVARHDMMTDIEAAIIDRNCNHITLRDCSGLCQTLDFKNDEIAEQVMDKIASSIADDCDFLDLRDWLLEREEME